MKYVLFLKGAVVAITDQQPWTGTPAMAVIKDADGKVIEYDKVQMAHGSDMKSLKEATSVAKQLTALTGQTFIPFDNGDYTSHRFGVMQPPAIGDVVSKGFNGDYYPCGEIVRVTPTMRVTAEDERGHKTVFSRRKQSANWREIGGGFSMVSGHHDERNPSF